jgi:hypothetical protein
MYQLGVRIWTSNVNPGVKLQTERHLRFMPYKLMEKGEESRKGRKEGNGERGREREIGKRERERDRRKETEGGQGGEKEGQKRRERRKEEKMSFKISQTTRKDQILRKRAT